MALWRPLQERTPRRPRSRHPPLPPPPPIRGNLPGPGPGRGRGVPQGGAELHRAGGQGLCW